MPTVILQLTPTDDGRTLTYGPHTEAPLAEELAASLPPGRNQSFNGKQPGGAPQQAGQAADTRVREQAQHAEQVRHHRPAQMLRSRTCDAGVGLQLTVYGNHL